MVLSEIRPPPVVCSNGDKKKRIDGGSSNTDSAELLKELFENCLVGDVDAVSQLVNEAIPVDKSNEEDVTALQVAAAHGRDDVVKLLIMKGAGLDKSNRKKWTPLMQAARHGQSNVVSTLLQNHADVNARSRAGANAMLLASRKGDLQTCKLLWGAGIDPSSQQSGDPCNPACDLTPMMVASYCGHRHLVEYFLECGEDVDQRSPNLGISCLIMAALGGHENIVKLLVEHGANPDKTDINNRTALDFAMTKNHRKVQGFLSKITTFKSKAAYEDAKLDIIEAVKKGNFMRVREILDRDISQRDAVQPDEGATALMFASVSGRLDVVQELVERGCDVDRQDEVSGWTALMQAVYHGKKAVAKYLLSAGAKVHIAAKNGYTAFDMLTLLDDVDTELYRMLAAATMGTPESSKSSTLKQGQQSESNLFSISRSRSQSRQNLKDWWLKMSDRFKHLKWGNNSTVNSTTSMNNNNNNNNRASSSTTGMSSSFAHLDRLRNVLNGFSSSPDSAWNRRKLHSTTLNVDSIAGSSRGLGGGGGGGGGGMEKVSSISTINTLGAIKETESPISVNSYEDDLDLLRDSLMYTVGNLGAKIGSSLKSDLPVFLPPPVSYGQQSGQMMPAAGKNGRRKSTESGQSRHKSGFFPTTTRHRRKSGASTLTSLTTNHLSPKTFDMARACAITRQPTTVSMTTNSSTSPSASGGSDELRRGMTLTSHSGQHHLPPTLQALERSKVNSSASSSTGTLTAGTDPHDRTPGNPDFQLPSRFLEASRASQWKSPVGIGQSGCSSFVMDDLGSILQKLSLEKYQPIFEEQEVDMETFLVLTDSNLKELGISHTESRNELLSAIDRINHAKK